MKSGGEPSNRISNANKNKKIIIVLISLFIIIAFVIVWSIISAGEIKILNIYHKPENPKPGDNITIIAEITGGSSLLGISAECIYDYFFNEGNSGRSSMISIGDNLFSFTHQSPYTEGAKIWYLIRADNTITEIYFIEVGNEKSNISKLTITNVTQYPKNPTNRTYSVQVSADIQSNVSITEFGILYKIIFPKRPLGACGDNRQSNGKPYTFSIPLIMEDPYSSSGNDKHYPKGSKVYYAIVAEDKLGNTAVSPIYNFTIR